MTLLTFRLALSLALFPRLISGGVLTRCMTRFTAILATVATRDTPQLMDSLSHSVLIPHMIITMDQLTARMIIMMDHLTTRMIIMMDRACLMVLINLHLRGVFRG
jgi:hypothetical protein